MIKEKPPRKWGFFYAQRICCDSSVMKTLPGLLIYKTRSINLLSRASGFSSSYLE
jgi:hypothetical protein